MTPIDALYAEKLTEAVFLYVFRRAFPAPLFRIVSIRKNLACGYGLMLINLTSYCEYYDCLYYKTVRKHFGTAELRCVKTIALSFRLTHQCHERIGEHSNSILIIIGYRVITN